MKRGKLIVFEGVSGTGKETQAKMLQAFLKKKGIISHIAFHPSPELKKDLKMATSVQQQIALLARDRRNRVRHLILPALRRGEWVISLRNYVSAYVYQGDGSLLQAFDPKPDWLFYFDIEPEISMKRIVSRGGIRGTYETMTLLDEKRKRYKEVLKTIPHIPIDASESILSLHNKIVSYIPL